MDDNDDGDDDNDQINYIKVWIILADIFLDMDLYVLIH